MKLKNIFISLLTACLFTTTIPTYGFLSFGNTKQIETIKKWIEKNGVSVCLGIATVLLHGDQGLNLIEKINHSKNFKTLLKQFTQLKGKNNQQLRELALSFLKNYNKLSAEEQNKVALAFLTTCKNLEYETKALFVPFLSREKEKFLKKLLENKKLETYTWKINKILYTLPAEKRAEYAELFFDATFEQLTDTLGLELMHHCSEQAQKNWSGRIAQRNPLLNPFTYEGTGPIFCHAFIAKALCSVLPLLNKHSAEKQEQTTIICKQALEFAKEEYKKGNIVIFHGQSDLWSFLEKIFNGLLFIKYGTTTPKNFVRLRFQEKPLLSNEEVIALRNKGTSDGDKHRHHVLFTNLHLLANNASSNSLDYILLNYDQTSCNSTAITYIQFQCAQLEMEQEYNTLISENPEFFNQLYDLHRKEVTARHNLGRLIAFSLPEESAHTLCYSATTGGPLRPYTINGEKTDDIVTIAQNYDQMPFVNRYCLILSEQITNPDKAQAAGITMRGFTSASTEESIKCAQAFEEEFQKVMGLIKQLYCKRIKG